jgi:lipopolysaccharide transport system permease protein
MESSVRSAEKPHLTIRPSAGWAALNLRELWQFRDLLITMAGRDVKLRYRQTALGVVWVILQPLLAAGVFSFVFGKVGGLAKPGQAVPYFVSTYAALLGWNAFNSTLTKASSCLVGNAHLVSKVFFPRLILPFSTVFSTLIDFTVAFSVMLVLIVIKHVPVHAELFLLPVWLLLILMLAMGLGLFASALMVTYRDVQYVLPTLTQFLQFVSPVVYTADQVLAHLHGRLQYLYFMNPLSGLITAFRWSLLGEQGIRWNYVLYGACMALIIFVWGAFSFKKMERKFADVI